jgi:hypothetical protein
MLKRLTSPFTQFVERKSDPLAFVILLELSDGQSDDDGYFFDRSEKLGCADHSITETSAHGALMCRGEELER